MSTLRERHLTALKQMLNLNQILSKSTTSEPVWKVLIYDRVGQDIISPLISVKELRELGVTLHVQLHSDRDQIPEVPAIYFCVPTDENIGRICQDLENSTYDQYHLNFISPISRQKLEDLASAAIYSNAVGNICKLYDQYLNFITLEDDLFVLKHQQSDALSYYSINRADTKDTEMEAIMDTIVDSLFSLFVTLGSVPVIRSSKGNAAEMVAKKLDKKLRENIWDARNNLFTGNNLQPGVSHFVRPMLIVLDRNQDMATPLHHTWTYQALAHDVLDLALNRAQIPSSASPGTALTKSKIKVCDLDSKDEFWTEHKGSPFPTVAEAIQEDLEKYRASEAEVKKLKSSMGLDGESDVALSMVSDNTQRLTDAVNSLPQLMEKKRLIDMHTTIATAILESIKTRRLDSFFELEEKIMSKSSGLEAKVVLDLINDTTAGLPEDKMRLFIIYFLCSQQITQAEFEKFEKALTDAGCDIKPLSYIKRWKTFTNLSSQYEGGGTKTVSMFSKLVSQGSSFVMEGVKNLVVKKHKLPVTRIVESAVNGSSASEELTWLEPRGTSRSSHTSQHNDVVVFVVGGGNYIEYHNLLDYVKITQAEFEKFEKALTDAGCDIKPLSYIKRWKTFTNLSSQYEGGGTKTVSMFSKLVSQGSSFVMEGVKNLVVKKHITQAEFEKFEKALTDAGCDIKPLSYIKRWKTFTNLSSQYEGGGTKTVSMFSKLVSQGSSFVMEGVKNLVVKKHKLPVTRIVESAVNGSSASEELTWLEPRGTSRSSHTSQHNDVVVFVVGGGNYIEYHNLLDYVKQQAANGINRRVIYGATTLPNANQFLKQLSLLGEEMN